MPGWRRSRSGTAIEEMNMQLKSPECRRHNERKSKVAAGTIRAAVVLSTICLGAGAGLSPAAAEEAATDVGYVVAVSGRVVALPRGKPVLLDTFDSISDRTRLDLLSNSELHVCHYRTQRILVLKGPARVMVSADGLKAEAGKAIDASEERCTAPVVSRVHGGLLTRGAAFKK
jgi:hypothetical protein